MQGAFRVLKEIVRACVRTPFPFAGVMGTGADPVRMVVSCSDACGRRHQTDMKAVRGFATLLTLVILLALAVLNLTCVGSVDKTQYLQHISFEPGNPFLRIPGAVMLGFVLTMLTSICMVIRFSRNGKTKLPPAVYVCAAFSAVLGLLWIRTNTYPPTADQRSVWQIACLIAEGKPLPDELVTYLIYYPHQKQIILFMSLLAAAFGPDPLSSYAVFNVICLFLLVIGMAQLADRIYHRNPVTVLTAWMSALFVPLIFYTTYVYGTIPSFALAVWGFAGTLDLTSQGQVSQVRNVLTAVGTGLVFVMAADFYRGTMIAVIAAALVIVSRTPGRILLCLKQRKGRHLQKQESREAGKSSGKGELSACIGPLIVLAVIAVCLPLSSRVSDRIFGGETGVAHSDGIPAPVWLDMGITARDGVNGPGSHDESDGRVYEEYGRDYGRIDADYRHKVLHDLRDYVDGDRDPSFFLEKTKVQWCDPWFSSAQLTIVPSEYDGAMPDTLEHFLNREIFGIPVVTWLEKILGCFLLLIYWCASGEMLTQLTSYRRERRHRKDPCADVEFPAAADMRDQAEMTGADQAILPALYFLGGFVFQFFWESKARYCMPYFVILFPAAADFMIRCRAVFALRRHRGKGAPGVSPLTAKPMDRLREVPDRLRNGPDGDR